MTCSFANKVTIYNCRNEALALMRADDGKPRYVVSYTVRDCPGLKPISLSWVHSTCSHRAKFAACSLASFSAASASAMFAGWISISMVRNGDGGWPELPVRSK